MPDTALATMPDPTKNTVLVPQREVAGRLTPLHIVNWTTITLDVNGETYPIQGGGRGLHKSALNKVASAAGVRVISSRPLSDPKDADYLLWQVEVEMDMGGEKPITAIGTKEWKKGVGKDGNDNEHRTSKTETKAMLRALRALLGIKTKYDAEELALPIAVPHIVYSPDLSDPDVAAFALARAGSAHKALYGGTPEAEAPEGVDALTGEFIDEDNDENPAPEVEVEVVEDAEDMPDFAGDDNADSNRQVELQGTLYSAKSSAFNGMTFAAIFEHPDGGEAWFKKVAAWGGANVATLTPGQKALVDSAVEFAALVKANGGVLL